MRRRRDYAGIGETDKQQFGRKGPRINFWHEFVAKLATPAAPKSLLRADFRQRC